MKLFKVLLPLCALALYSCSMTPAFITYQPNARGIQVALFEQDLGDMKNFSRDITDDKTILLPDNNFISLRTARYSPHRIAPSNIVLERYNEKLSSVWATPLELKPGEFVAHIIQNNAGVNLILMKKESASSFSFSIGGAKLGGNSRVQCISRTYDLTTGKLTGEKELVPMQDWSDDHNLTFRYSPDSSKIAINVFESDESTIKVHIFNKSLTLLNSAEIKNYYDKDNDEFPQDILISNAGMIYRMGLYENTLDITRYNPADIANPQRATIDVAKALGFRDDMEVQSIIVKQTTDNLHVVLQYGEDVRVSAVAVLDYNPSSQNLTVANDLLITPQLSAKLIGMNVPEDYHINNAFFAPNGDRTIILEKRRQGDFTRPTSGTTTRMGGNGQLETKPQDGQMVKNVSMGNAFLYETIIALNFKSDGKLQWSQGIQRQRTPKPFSNAVGIHSTDETSAITQLYDKTLYIGYRDRNMENEQGFSLHKISTDNGSISRVTLPFAMQNAGYGVFFLRNMTQWTPDGKVILFTKEAVEENNSGKIIKLDLNQM